MKESAAAAAAAAKVAEEADSSAGDEAARRLVCKTSTSLKMFERITFSIVMRSLRYDYSVCSLRPREVSLGCF